MYKRQGSEFVSDAPEFSDSPELPALVVLSEPELLVEPKLLDEPLPFVVEFAVPSVLLSNIEDEVDVPASGLVMLSDASACSEEELLVSLLSVIPSTSSKKDSILETGFSCTASLPEREAVFSVALTGESK